MTRTSCNVVIPLTHESGQFLPGGSVCCKQHSLYIWQNTELCSKIFMPKCQLLILIITFSSTMLCSDSLVMFNLWSYMPCTIVPHLHIFTGSKWILNHISFYLNNPHNFFLLFYFEVIVSLKYNYHLLNAIMHNINTTAIHY